MPFREQPMLYSADLHGCATVSRLSSDVISAAFISALERAGATVVRTLAHDFPGTGLTCIAILAESHAVLHTWPETGTVNLDIFSCSTALQSRTAIAELGRSFGAVDVSVQEIPRADGYGARSARRP
ncbi:MAG: adenosylmethionine decarboxylase [Vicinamibacterales bacterium]